MTESDDDEQLDLLSIVRRMNPLRNPHSYPLETIEDMLRTMDVVDIVTLSQVNKTWQKFFRYDFVFSVLELRRNRVIATALIAHHHHVWLQWAHRAIPPPRPLHLLRIAAHLYADDAVIDRVCDNVLEPCLGALTCARADSDAPFPSGCFDTAGPNIDIYAFIVAHEPLFVNDWHAQCVLNIGRGATQALPVFNRISVHAGDDFGRAAPWSELLSRGYLNAVTLFLTNHSADSRFVRLAMTPFNDPRDWALSVERVAAYINQLPAFTAVVSQLIAERGSLACAHAMSRLACDRAPVSFALMRGGILDAIVTLIGSDALEVSQRDKLALLEDCRKLVCVQSPIENVPVDTVFNLWNQLCEWTMDTNRDSVMRAHCLRLLALTWQIFNHSAMFCEMARFGVKNLVLGIDADTPLLQCARMKLVGELVAGCEALTDVAVFEENERVVDMIFAAVQQTTLLDLQCEGFFALSNLCSGSPAQINVLLKRNVLDVITGTQTSASRRLLGNVLWSFGNLMAKLREQARLELLKRRGGMQALLQKLGLLANSAQSEVFIEILSSYVLAKAETVERLQMIFADFLALDKSFIEKLREAERESEWSTKRCASFEEQISDEKKKKIKAKREGCPVLQKNGKKKKKKKKKKSKQKQMSVTSRKTSLAPPVTSGESGVTHSYTEEEKVGFVEYINSRLKHDKDVANLIPIDSKNMDIIDAIKGSVLLNKLLHNLFPEKIDISSVIVNNKMNVFEAIQNHNHAIKGARAVGVKVVGIGAEDLRDGVVYLVFGILWQIIKHGLLSRVNVDEHPELLELGLEEAELAKLSAAHPEQLLLRWVNFHLRNSGSDRTMTNFTSDVQDSEVYVRLLNQLAPRECALDILDAQDPLTRAESVLEAAELLNCRKFVSPPDIVSGNYKLNMAFVANLFDRSALFERNAARARQEQLAKVEEDAAKLAAQTAAAEARAKAAESAARAAEAAAAAQAKEAAERAADAEKRRADAEAAAAAREKRDAAERDALKRQASQRAADLKAAAEQRERELQAQLTGLEGERAEAMRRSLAEREALEGERNALLEQLAAATQERDTSRAHAADLDARLATLEQKLSESETARAASEQQRVEEVAKTKAGARDWYAKHEEERAAAEAKLTARGDAWHKKALDKEALLKKYQEALKQARAQRDEGRAALKQASEDADEHHKQQLAERDGVIAQLRAQMAENQARHVAELEAVRARQQSSDAGEMETLKQQAMEALHHVQGESVRQLAAQKLQYEAELARLQHALAAAENAAIDKSSDDGEARSLKKKLKALEKHTALLRDLTETRQGYLIKYGERNKTWNKRLFALKHNVLVYYREDGSPGGVLELDGIDVLAPHDLGIVSGTSAQTIGFNKPTAFEFVLSSPSKNMRVCATDAADEADWKNALERNRRAWKAFEKLTKDH